MSKRSKKMRANTKRKNLMDEIQWKSNEHKHLMHHLFWADTFAEYSEVFAHDRAADGEFYREVGRRVWRLAMDICKREGYSTSFITPDLENNDDPEN